VTRLVVVLIVVALAGTGAGQQPGWSGQSSAGTARLDGRVVYSGDSQPVRRAVVTLGGAAIGDGRVEITDADGRFAFEALPPGRFTLSAAKPAQVTSYYGSRRPGQGPGVPVAIADGQHAGVTLTMLRGAVIAGRVFDHFGRSQRHAIVSILAPRRAGGPPAVVRTTTTDDLGEYRAWGLAPGRYVVAVQPGFGFNGAAEPGEADFRWAFGEAERRSRRGGLGTAEPRPRPAPRQTVSWAPSLFPGVPSLADVHGIDLGEGEERTGIDVQLNLTPTTRLAGRVVGPDGSVPGDIRIAIVWPGHALGLAEKNYIGRGPSNLGMTVQDGAFTRSALQPGRYTFVVRASSRGAAVRSADGPPPLDLWARVDVDINGELERELLIALQPGMTVRGRVTMEGRPPPRTVRVTLTAVSDALNLAVSPVQSEEDGGFAFPGVAPGAYALRIDDAAMVVAGATMDDSDVADEALYVRPGLDVDDLSIELGERRASLTGRLLDSRGRPAPEFVIVAFARDRAMWRPLSRRTAEARPATDGTYTISGLPVGDYFIAAVTELDPGALDDPEFLALLAASAQPVTITGGEPVRLDLQIGGGQ
jgi:hypothetical protein